MLSQNQSKMTVPSYYMIRTNLPHRQPLNQWKGVYYFSGLTKRQQRRILLQHKANWKNNTILFHEQRKKLLEFHAQLEATLLQTKSATTTAPASAALFQHALKLNAFGLTHLSGSILDGLHRDKQLNAAAYAQWISSLSASHLADHVLRTDAGYDPALVYKLMADRQGAERLTEARRVFELANSALGSTTSAAHYNALMSVMMSCGFESVTQVSDRMYDLLGVRQVAPTARTYELVMQSLALQGKLEEGHDILQFLRSHHSEDVTIDMMNHLLMGHREMKQFDQCDAVWSELVQRQWPRANVQSAELFLRSIVDHSYTRATNNMSRFSNIHTVEKKRIPLILTQLDELGIPRVHLSPPLLDEVEDALRKFSIHKSRFYQWGRAVKQFEFIEFRRKNGWMYDLPEMVPTKHIETPVRDPELGEGAVGPAGGAEVPGFIGEKQPWLLQPLDDVLTVSDHKERMEDVRAGDIYYDDHTPVHQRPLNWMNEVPQTRYDKLYGMSKPEIPKIGIRRHLEGEYLDRDGVRERDSTVVKNALSASRRLRQKQELAKTHRVAAF